MQDFIFLWGFAAQNAYIVNNVVTDISRNVTKNNVRVCLHFLNIICKLQYLLCTICMIWVLFTTAHWKMVQNEDVIYLITSLISSITNQTDKTRVPQNI